MGALMVATQHGAPPAGGGSFTMSAPNVGDIINVASGSSLVQVTACVGDWVFAIVICNGAGTYVGPPPWGGFSHVIGWTQNVFGPSNGGAFGTNILAAQLGGFLDNPQSVGAGSTDVDATMFLLTDNKSTVTVGGNPEHQYTIENSQFLSAGAGTFTFPTFSPATPQPWVYYLLSGAGNFGGYTGMDTGWETASDTVFPSWARYPVPNPNGASLTPAPITTGASTPASGLVLAVSDAYSNPSAIADRTLGARRVRPETRSTRFESGGGVWLT